ncbi:MAG: DUF4390 domain-containing protein [Gammaproteobacteria bacterium]|nr:DUF4390 domain-containing protein [Gammaproteobacteria bacterium]
MRGEKTLALGGCSLRTYLRGNKNDQSPRRWRRGISTLVGCVLGVFGGLAQAEDFTVRNASTSLDQQIYRLSADLGYHFSPVALDALGNGVALTLVLDIEVFEPRRYLWGDVVAALEQRYQIRYHALSDQYILRRLNSGSQSAYSSLDRALASLGKISDLPIIDAPLLAESSLYKVRVRSRLDIDSLPVPLRLKAYISSDWWMDSGWYAWDL